MSWCPQARTDLAPQVDLELRVRTFSSPALIALEMESCPAAPASDVEEVADVTEDIADAVQAALGTPRKLAHLLSGRAPVAPRLQLEPTPAPARGGRSLRLLAAVSLAAAGVLLAVQVSAPKPPPPSPRRWWSTCPPPWATW
ncbi:hypothetical protein [Corallococcus sp. AB038B]|uniref:hypothetical protein n=1 Tax=Corallococcus sp. AB038B TaxID=2316718 RepID=UPI000EE6B5D5|nr:hypothetical protein [Corallococcus sp. AB038B]RKH93591.1 hypothetical protein D7Y04_40000 [Corallococcus sp. AB038B]